MAGQNWAAVVAADSVLGMERYLRLPSPLLVVISGPSGVGKDAVVKRMKELGYPFHFVVTATSRPPRPGEVDGVDYFFLSKAEYDRLIAQDGFVEHAVVYGKHYGVPKAQIRNALASGQDVVMRVDVQGAATLRRLIPGAVLIFLLPGSELELTQRLKGRDSDTPEALEKRMATLREEVTRIQEFDYVVVNRQGDLDRTVQVVAAIITAEKCRTRQRLARLPGDDTVEVEGGGSA